MVDVGQPKVLDFGVARLTDSDVTLTTVGTEVGQIIGTLPYMSPEQATGRPDEIDARRDVYAPGVVGYELLTGSLPYEVAGLPLPQAVRVVQFVEPTPLSSHNRVLRGDVETIIGKALEKKKTRRYPSAAALAADIRRYLRSEPIVARPPSAGQPQLGLDAAEDGHRHRVAGLLGLRDGAVSEPALDTQRRAKPARRTATRASHSAINRW